MKNIVFIPILLILFTSCRKSKTTNLDCNDANTLFAPQLAKDLYAFKPGTWWVYEDLINHSFDSVWVGENTSVKQTMTTDDGNCSRCVEINTTKLYNKKYNLQATDSKYRTSYVDIIMRPLYVSAFSTQNSVNYNVDIEVVAGEKYPYGKYQFQGAVFNKDSNTSSHVVVKLDTIYGLKNINSNYGIVHRLDINSIYDYSFIQLSKYGCYMFISKRDSTAIILRRYNIVQ